MARWVCWSHSPGTSQRPSASISGIPAGRGRSWSMSRTTPALDQHVDRPDPARAVVQLDDPRAPQQEVHAAHVGPPPGVCSTPRYGAGWPRPGIGRHVRQATPAGGEARQARHLWPHSGRTMTINLQDDAFDRGRGDVREAAHRLRTARDRADQRVTGFVHAGWQGVAADAFLAPGTTGASPPPTSSRAWSRWPS